MIKAKIEYRKKHKRKSRGQFYLQEAGKHKRGDDLLSLILKV